jgi:hypothetical protein
MIGVRIPAGAGRFSVHHPASYPMGTGALSLGVKRQGREADHLPPSSAEVKNEWSCTSTPQYAFMAWCSVKAQRQLYLYLIAASNVNSTLYNASVIPHKGKGIVVPGLN